MVLLDRLSTFLLILGGIALLAMMVHVSADVIFKRVFGTPLQGTTEMVSSYYMVACVFLGLGVVQRERKQIAVEFFTESLRGRHRAAVNIFSGGVTIILASLLVWMGTDQAIQNTLDRETNWSTIANFEIWPTRWFPVVAYAAMLAYLLIQLWGDLKVMVQGSKGQEQ
ncbi:TRAP transporter small permease [Marivita hallyeonensis]|uniref:TRAP transporter small permease protein n=1 Tax=Marivita hallyeonensis TaxID=996342 RepID=A0A1M5XN43_9RHOB|nr:TRAP transporter small permease [Marivita hallyeonensis]SHI01169.1 TRAP-type C4-dicarboxylate transport system, small permease component [Marivita hallyeonensis]